MRLISITQWFYWRNLKCYFGSTEFPISERMVIAQNRYDRVMREIDRAIREIEQNDIWKTNPDIHTARHTLKTVYDMCHDVDIMDS